MTSESRDQPTLYEFAGGHQAMVRLAAAQYRRCLTDPILTEVFGTTGRPLHVEHVAAWLDEVFGGPSTYTERLGGHEALVRHHAGMKITEQQRQRFVEAFMESADEAELPKDRRFRDRLRAYLDWGAAVAVDISNQTEEEAAASAGEVPRWDWGPEGPPPAT